MLVYHLGEQKYHFQPQKVHITTLPGRVGYTIRASFFLLLQRCTPCVRVGSSHVVHGKCAAHRVLPYILRQPTNRLLGRKRQFLLLGTSVTKAGMVRSGFVVLRGLISASGSAAFTRDLFCAGTWRYFTAYQSPSSITSAQ